MEEKSLTLSQIFNCDETGLYWKLLPNKTLVAAHEKEAKGYKMPKDRVTLMACANATGSIKLPLVLCTNQKIPVVLSMLTKTNYLWIIMHRRILGWIHLYSRNGFIRNLYHSVEKHSSMRDFQSMQFYF